jgi:uncharacterized protein (TIGR04222 family)
MTYVNPIDALSGPEFLIVFGVYCTIVVALAAWAVHREDPGTRIVMPPATQADPFEIAYLRGGTNDVLRLTIFELVREGYLKLDSSKAGADPDIVSQMALHPELDRLPRTWRTVFDFFTTPRDPGDIFRSPVRAEIDDACAPYKARLESEHLLAVDATRRAAWPVRIGALISLLTPAVYRLTTSAIHHHRNVIFLILMTIAAVVALAVATRVRRVTARGRRFLHDLRTAYRPASSAGGAFTAAAATLPLLVAVNGTAALAGTPYAGMNTMFARSNSYSGGDSGGGCGSSGGDGGGGGGCGGGGCGGGG